MTGSDMLYLAGLAGLLIVAVLMIRRGGARKPDPDSNKSDIGGGPHGGSFGD